MEKEEIGKKIKILRKTRGLTQQQLADKLSPPVKRATISNWEIARRSPDIHQLEALCEALNVNLDYFGFGGSAAVDLVARAKVLFEDNTISAEEKAQAYKSIMKLYLDIEE